MGTRSRSIVKSYHEPDGEVHRSGGLASPRLSARVGAPLGVPLYVHATWLLPLVAVSAAVGAAVVPAAARPAQYAAGTGIALVLYACVLAHEYAHVAVAARFGVRARAVYLHLLGATALFDRDLSAARQEVAVAAAGPAASLLLALLWGGGAFAAFTHGADAAGQALGVLAGANAWLFVLNLVPAYPMDGGRLLYAAVWAATGSVARGRVIATRIAVAIGTATLGAGVWLAGAVNPRYAMWALIGTFLLIHALGEALGRGKAGGVPGIEWTGGAAEAAAAERDRIA